MGLWKTLNEKGWEDVRLWTILGFISGILAFVSIFTIGSVFALLMLVSAAGCFTASKVEVARIWLKDLEKRIDKLEKVKRK